MSKVASTRPVPFFKTTNGSDSSTKTKRRTLTSLPQVADDKVPPLFFFRPLFHAFPLLSFNLTVFSRFQVQLKSVFGMTAASNCQLACSPTGLVAYPSGCAVVLYDPKANTQVSFLTHAAMKTVASLAFSCDSRYLAVGEVRPPTLHSHLLTACQNLCFAS